MQNTIYAFNGSNITFSSGEGNIMVNATEMAKPFGKRVQHFLSTDQTKEYLNALCQSRNFGFADLVQVKKGGLVQGTWMHEDVALEFARWLSPAFAIWCNDRIKELLKYGMTANDATLEQMINNPDLVIALATQLKDERAEKQRLREINGRLQQRTQFVDAVFESPDLITISQAAKLLGLSFGRTTLFRLLREKGILFKNTNEPKQELVNKGYFKLKEKSINRENHPPKIVMQTYLTQTGLGYLAKALGVVNPPDFSKTPILNT